MSLDELVIGNCYEFSSFGKSQFMVLEHGYESKPNQSYETDFETDAWGDYALVSYGIGDNRKLYMRECKYIIFVPISKDEFLIGCIN
tara:strand:- start:436 stop:696 length:261 start_codon:yes stop_codon:yes gene_type:complete